MSHHRKAQETKMCLLCRPAFSDCLHSPNPCNQLSGVLWGLATVGEFLKLPLKSGDGNSSFFFWLLTKNIGLSRNPRKRGCSRNNSSAVLLWNIIFYSRIQFNVSYVLKCIKKWGLSFFGVLTQKSNIIFEFCSNFPMQKHTKAWGFITFQGRALVMPSYY